MDVIILLWNEAIIRPMLNTLMVLYVVCFNQMGLAIIVFTVIVRVITMPLFLKQIHQMQGMTKIQPKMKEVQERFKGDRARVSQETMRLYKEAGISPVGCLGPMVVQMPILFGLFRVLIQTLFAGPDELVSLSEKLYSWIGFVSIHSAAPLNNAFFGIEAIDLGANPGRLMFFIPLLVAASTWVQQKMTTTPSADPRQQANQNMMLYMIPIMLGFFSFTFPIGLSLYWTISNVIGVAMQYFISGWGPLFPLLPKATPAPEPADPSPQVVSSEEMTRDGNSNTNRTNRRRGRRTGIEGARRRPQRGRGRNSK